MSPLDPWTWNRISGPLEELVAKWKDWEHTCILSGQTMLNWCASDLEAILTKWQEEADEVSERLFQEHLREEGSKANA